MLAALDQATARSLDLRDRAVEVNALITKETEMLNRRGPTDLVKRDHVFRPGQLEERHLVADPKRLSRPEDPLVKQQRPPKIRDVQVNVVQSPSQNHAKILRREATGRGHSATPAQTSLLAPGPKLSGMCG